jgi:hypothetical protein
MSRGESTYGWMGDLVLFAEAASCQLEYKYLAKLTGRAEYYEKVHHIYYDPEIKDSNSPCRLRGSWISYMNQTPQTGYSQLAGARKASQLVVRQPPICQN